MKMFSECAGKCGTCILTKCCLAGHGDNDYYPAPKEEIIRRLDKNEYPSLRNSMIQYLKDEFNYDYNKF